MWGGGAKTLHTYVSAHPEPQIKRHPNNLTLLLDSKAVLPCITLGNPKPEVIWLKDEELIQVPERQRVPNPPHTGATSWQEGAGASFYCLC